MPTHRSRMLSLLRAYSPVDPREQEMLIRMTEFAVAHENCCERTLASGHMTGSAWVLDEARKHVLLTHHRKLNRWLQLGGHADGDADLLQVALREAHEESGLTNIRPVSEAPFDIDIHEIPARGAEPLHFHYDVRYVMQADRNQPLIVSEESNELAWMPLRGLDQRPDIDESLRRMIRKTIG